MATFNIKLELFEEIKLYGLWKKSNDKTVSKDIPSLSSKYYFQTNTRDGDVLPFFIVSRNYDENTRDFELFVGGLITGENLECLVLPKCQYARITIKPKFGFAWGLAVGEAKRYFYTKWLPSSDYKAVNLEYEYHTEKSLGKNPSVEIIFAIEERTE